jgi:hypothetical protein
MPQGEKNTGHRIRGAIDKAKEQIRDGVEKGVAMIDSSQQMWSGGVPAVNIVGQPIFGTANLYPSWGGNQPQAADLGMAIVRGSEVIGKPPSAMGNVFMGTGQINTLPNSFASSVNQAMPGQATTNILGSSAMNATSALGAITVPGF